MYYCVSSMVCSTYIYTRAVNKLQIHIVTDGDSMRWIRSASIASLIAVTSTQYTTVINIRKSKILSYSSWRERRLTSPRDATMT